MSLKRLILFLSMIVAVSLPACANSATPMSEDLGTYSSTGTRAYEGMQGPLAAGLAYQSALHEDSSGARPLTAHWDSSRPTEALVEQERTATLPEPESGVLLVVGLVAIAFLMRKRTPRRTSLDRAKSFPAISQTA